MKWLLGVGGMLLGGFELTVVEGILTTSFLFYYVIVCFWDVVPSTFTLISFYFLYAKIDKLIKQTAVMFSKML